MGADSGGNPIEFRGGPPSYPNVLDGTYPSGFEGFTQGFVEFEHASGRGYVRPFHRGRCRKRGDGDGYR